MEDRPGDALPRGGSPDVQLRPGSGGLCVAFWGVAQTCPVFVDSAQQFWARGPERGCVRPRGMQLSAEVAKGMSQPGISAQLRASRYFLELPRAVEGRNEYGFFFFFFKS